MPTNSVFSQFMLDAKEAVTVVTGLLPANVHIGHFEWSRHQDFFSYLPNVGYALYIGCPRGESDLVDFNGEFESEGELYYTIPADAPNTMVDVMNTVASIQVAWATYAPWTQGKDRSPYKLTWEAPEYLTSQKPFVVRTGFKLFGRFIVDQAAAPGLVPAVT